MLLDLIKKENDIKKIDRNDWDNLAAEIRQFLVEKIKTECVVETERYEK